MANNQAPYPFAPRWLIKQAPLLCTSLVGHSSRGDEGARTKREERRCFVLRGLVLRGVVLRASRGSTSCFAG